MKHNKFNLFGKSFFIVGLAILFLVPLVSAGLTWTRATGQTFNQDLNTYDDVTFNDLTATGDLTDTACFTLEASFKLSTNSYWKFGLNMLSAGEGVEMIADGSVTQYGWTCSNSPVAGDTCTHEIEVRTDGSTLIEEAFISTNQNDAFEYSRNSHSFNQGDLIQMYYQKTGGICLSASKISCGGFVCVVYDN